MKIGKNWRRGGRSLRGRWPHWTSLRVFWRNFLKISWRETRAREVHSKRRLGALHRFVFPGDSTEADRAGAYRARFGVNVAAYEKKHENE